MAPVLGKRKREAASEKSKSADNGCEREQTPTEDETNILQDVLRRHFEQRFKPLDVVEKQEEPEKVEEEPEEESEEEWSGLSEGEESEVEIVEANGGAKRSDILDGKSAMKAFMVCALLIIVYGEPVPNRS
jgi:hypothetical protein